MREPIYKTGDKIKIVNYGHLIWFSKTNYQEQRKASRAFAHERNILELKWLFGENCKLPPKPKYVEDLNAKPKNIISENDYLWHCDASPKKVGMKDVIEKVSTTQGIPKYSLVKNGAWYQEDQLELLK